MIFLNPLLYIYIYNIYTFFIFIFVLFYLFFIYLFILIYMKMSNNLSAKFYQQNKKILQKKAFKKYQNLSKYEKNKWQYGRERYKILSEHEEQNLLSMEKNIIEWEKMPYHNYKKL